MPTALNNGENVSPKLSGMNSSAVTSSPLPAPTSPPATMSSPHSSASAQEKVNKSDQESQPHVNNSSSQNMNIGEIKPIKNKMPSSTPQQNCSTSISSSLFSGLGVKNPMSAFGKSISIGIGNLSGNINGGGGLPPIPPPGIMKDVEKPTKPARASLAVSKARLKSPSRKQTLTLEDLHALGANLPGMSRGRKKSSFLGGKRYASSLPDERLRNACSSPVAFDINSFLSHNQGPIDFSSLLGQNSNTPTPTNQSGRTKGPQSTQQNNQPNKPGQGKPTKHCKNKHMWARASLERDFDCRNHSDPHCQSPVGPTNRHSSYHPNYPNDPTSAAAAAAAAAAYNAHMFFSRPTSPLFLDSGSYCSGGGDFMNLSSSPFCHSCAVKTLPRTRPNPQNPNHGLCHCCHQGGNHDGISPNGLMGGSLLGLDYEDRLLRLESDKETLHLQVSVLSDQIEAQTDKIKDLEKCLDDKRNTLESTEDHLQKELLTRSSLETQKLELLTELSSLRLKQASLERENYELKERCQGKSLGDLSYIDGGHNNTGQSNGGRIWDKPPLVPLNPLRSNSPSQNLLSGNNDQRIRLGSGSGANDQQPRGIRTPPANAYRRVVHTEQSAFGTVPRRSPHSSQLSTFNGQLSLSPDVNCGGGNVTNYSSGGKTSSLSSGNINVITAFNNAAMDKQDWERNKSTGNIGVTTNGNNKGTKDKSPSTGGHKSRGIMRILGKLRRSNSGGLDNDQIAPLEGPGNFVRGGVRATAQPRLGWVKEPSPPKKPEGPITSWDSESVIKWLNFIGLAAYSGDVKRWVKTGQQLLDASPQELEKELGVKNHLHRKKLVLALNAFKTPEEEDNAGKLDYNWVIRWLDDVGLPQYKETFAEARVDGRVLNYLTAEDLISLKVTSMLHHVCIKRGIQVLRIHKFHPDCLCRRGGPTPGVIARSERLGNNNGSNGSGDYGSSDGGSSGSNLWGPQQVANWTNHRVMEWLKAIDLAEYAPNLRGSGVHGALMIFECRFNAELMATLLSIPSNKTLLRRHLSLQINELVGKQIVLEKRSAELASDFIPINPTTKVKVVKKSQFPLRKKRLSTDYAAEELLCPMDLCVFPSTNSDSTGQLSSLDNSLDSSPGDKVSNI